MESLNMGDRPDSRPSHIKLGPDGELEEPMPVPEIGTFRRSRLRRIVDAVVVRREVAPCPDAEAIERFNLYGLTTEPTKCRHCGTHWPAGSKPYCVTCGYPLPSKPSTMLRDELGQLLRFIIWGSVYVTSIGALIIGTLYVYMGRLSIIDLGVVGIGCITLAIFSQIVGGFGKYGGNERR